MSEIAVVKYLFREDWSPLEEVLKKGAKDFGQVQDLDAEKDVIEIIKTNPATLVIAAVTGKNELTQVLGFLKSQKRLIKEANVKFSVINYLNNKQVEAALMKLGCQEVMDPEMKSKALKFKMDFWKKALSVGQNKALDPKMSLKDKVAENRNKAIAQSQNPAAAKVDANPIKWLDPIKHVDDMWISKNTADVKKVLSRWMIKLTGPSPFVGQWMEVPGERGVWTFTFKEGHRDTFHMADGNWLFSGET
ncbi:MAG: hypothetical protein K2P81_17330, partial [Bacteriovoracaceae bacterium]|nr:hypothetical protein [Bacteriovoracaceae bacterium]